jgi:hypothetical protein
MGCPDTEEATGSSPVSATSKREITSLLAYSEIWLTSTEPILLKFTSAAVLSI